MDIISYLVDDDVRKVALSETKAGQLYAKLTEYSYVKFLHFWADLNQEGKLLSKMFQCDGVLLSDVTSGVEDCISAVRKLRRTPGPWMMAFEKDYDSIEMKLDGISLVNTTTGLVEYTTSRNRHHLT